MHYWRNKNRKRKRKKRGIRPLFLWRWRELPTSLGFISVSLKLNKTSSSRARRQLLIFTPFKSGFAADFFQSPPSSHSNNKTKTFVLVLVLVEMAGIEPASALYLIKIFSTLSYSFRKQGLSKKSNRIDNPDSSFIFRHLPW